MLDTVSIGTPDSARMILVSILNWNGTDDTVACLRALDRTADQRVVFLVLDNGSREDPTAVFRYEFPDVEFRREPTNLGFTGGHNLAIQMALHRGYGSVLLLNNDCKIDMAAILELQRCLDDDPQLAGVSPLIFRDETNRKAVAVAGWIDWAQHRCVRPSDPDATAPSDLPIMLVGTALLLRCETLRRIGVLDDRYFAYYEDNDMSARIAAAGYRSLYCKTASCVHRYRKLEDYGAMALYLLARNSWLFWRTHTPPRHKRRMFRDLLAQLLQDVAQLKTAAASTEKMDAMIDGFWDAQRGRFGPPSTKRSSPWLLRRSVLAAPWMLGQLVRNPLPTIVNKWRGQI